MHVEQTNCSYVVPVSMDVVIYSANEVKKRPFFLHQDDRADGLAIGKHIISSLDFKMRMLLHSSRKYIKVHLDIIMTITSLL